MPSPQVGTMREQLTIERQTTTKDSHGAVVTREWADLATLHAELLVQRASEAIRAAQMQAVAVYRFRVWARSDVTTTMRAKWSPSWAALETPKTLQILSVLPFGDGRQWTVIEAAEIAEAEA